ncbi:hypothetical protein ACN38_g7449 [Penicillium nordicum]|uniref:Uncharacterized protein n=1 Tax=Penicillium nordicum TaxID=229535 RepID=A0A0M8P6G3_9EURO|nr:hypothetical protein ACN38_g7449 [Penicillium nordicum]
MVYHSESEVPAPIVTHIEQLFSSGLPHLNPSDMALPQTEKIFNIKEARGLQSWQFPSIHIVLPAGFGIQTSLSIYNISGSKLLLAI